MILIASLLSGCAFMKAIQMLGGGTSSASKGHGNDNTLLIGSDVSNGISTGGKVDIDADDVHGDITGGDKKDVSVAQSGDIHISHSVPWWVWLIISLLIPSPVEKVYRLIENLVGRKKNVE